MDVLQYVKPELLVLAAALYLVGLGLKKTQAVADKWIPFCLGAAGIVLACLWVAATSELSGVPDVLLAVFTGITQGLLCAGASVYADQLVKQAKKRE